MDFWLLFAGLGFFLLGMRELETGLSGLGRQQLRLLLSKHTGTPARGVALGALATGLLQSSSLLSLIVLAFAGASLLSLSASLAIVFGANLGTTLTGWIITTLGFKLNLSIASYFLIGVGALGLSLRSTERLNLAFRIITGFGLLVLGLNEMKEAVFDLRQHIDLAQFAHMPIWLFFLLGILIASIIQSSSATIGITLAALHSGIIELTPAAALVIGADLGTTSTLILGALGGAPIKKQIAFGQILFNLIINLVALIILLPLLTPALVFLNINDNLYALVLFHTTFNLTGVLAFLPFIKYFSNWLETKFTATGEKFVLHVHQVNPSVPEAALSAATTDTQELLQKLATYAHVMMQNNLESTENETSLYRDLKSRESGLLKYLRQLYAEKLNSDEARQLESILQASREAVLAAKALKDIRHNILYVIEQNQENQYYLQIRQFLFSLITSINEQISSGRLDSDEWLDKRQTELNTLTQKVTGQIYLDQQVNEISSILNLTREMQEFGARLLSGYKFMLQINHKVTNELHQI